MSIRTILTTLCLLLIIPGVMLIQTGCGVSSNLIPSAVFTSEEYSVPTLQLTNMGVAGDPVLVGIGSTFRITWETINPPPDAVIKLFLSTSGIAGDSTNVEITPTNGVPFADKGFNFSPARGQGQTGIDYWVIGQLMSNRFVFDTKKSVRRLRIGEGGLIITNPASNLSLARGLPLTIIWQVTNNVCEELKDKTKIIRLYVDTVGQFDNATAIELTPVEGLDACVGQLEVMTGEIPRLIISTPYYVIGRLFIDGVEHSRAVSGGTFTTTPSLRATSPLLDVQANLQAIQVSWQILDRDPSGLKVEVLAQRANVPNDPERIISGEFSAEKGIGVADASKLPTGTYNVVLRLFERNAALAKVILDTATAPGRILVNPGYAGSFDLADMSAAVTRNYSPVDGVVFEGFNINDQAGFEVAGIGDLNADNRTDFLIFSRYGQGYTAGNAGSAYLIYGRDNFTRPLVNLNSIASPNPAGRPVDGTLIQLPMENLASMDGPYIKGTFKAIGTPDFSTDGKGDLLIGCPEAAPLQIWFYNEDSTRATLQEDQYGLQRVFDPGGHYIEPCHVQPHIYFVDGFGTAYHLYYPNDFQPGDVIDVHLIPPSPWMLEITVYPHRERRGTAYLVTSERLAQNVNKVFDLAKVGSPALADLDGLSVGYAYDQMWTWSPFAPGVRFGADISVLPDRDGDGRAEILLSAPEDTVTDFATVGYPQRASAGMGIVLGGEYRWNSLINQSGNIAWGYAAEGDGAVKEHNARNTIGENAEVYILGGFAGSELTGLAGLGRFDNISNYGTYSGGDFNGDNVPDIVAGTPGENNGAGTIYVLPVRPLFGHRVQTIDLADFNKPIPVGPETSLKVPVLGLKISGTVAGERLGEVVKPAGDFNGDGLADVMFSTPQADASGRSEAGRVFLVFGQNLLGDFTLDDVDSHLGTQIPALIFEGQAPFEHLGMRICSVYDVNGDGMDDILLAAPDANAPGKNGCGKVYLLYGKRNIVKTDPGTGFKFVDYNGDNQPDEFWSVQDVGIRIPGAVFIGEHANTHLQAISPAGDVNGDGIGDFLLGAPNTNVSTVQQNAGKAYLVLGRKYVVPQR